MPIRFPTQIPLKTVGLSRIRTESLSAVFIFIVPSPEHFESRNVRSDFHYKCSRSTFLFFPTSFSPWREVSLICEVPDWGRMRKRKNKKRLVWFLSTIPPLRYFMLHWNDLTLVIRLTFKNINKDIQVTKDKFSDFTAQLILLISTRRLNEIIRIRHTWSHLPVIAKMLRSF